MAQFIDQIRAALPAARAQHSINVAETAKKLAEHHRLPTGSAYIAGLFHDIAKYRTPSDSPQVPDSINELWASYPLIWHAFAGPYILETEFNIHDSDILSAVRWHTTGKDNMTLLEQILYLADYIEPGRPFPNRSTIEALSFESLDRGTVALASSSLSNLLARGIAIHPSAVDCYNHYQKKLGNAESKQIIRILQERTIQ
ncbi:HD domain-containing protein [bacterium]|nr:HD domain-containing protein [bacterium]